LDPFTTTVWRSQSVVSAIAARRHIDDAPTRTTHGDDQVRAVRHQPELTIDGASVGRYSSFRIV
jgi:hypothetical protein